MRVLVDVDGVLGDFATEVVRFLNQYARPGGTMDWTIDSVTSFDILECLGVQHMQERVDRHMAEVDYCRNMPPFPGAREFLDELREWHDVTIVTSPYSAVPNWCHARIEWLRQHFDVDKRDVIFAKRKELIRGEVLIDDCWANVVSFPGEGILFDRPWNREYGGPYRARDYGEALARVEWMGRADVCVYLK